MVANIFSELFQNNSVTQSFSIQLLNLKKNNKNKQHYYTLKTLCLAHGTANQLHFGGQRPNIIAIVIHQRFCCCFHSKSKIRTCCSHNQCRFQRSAVLEYSLKSLSSGCAWTFSLLLCEQREMNVWGQRGAVRLFHSINLGHVTLRQGCNYHRQWGQHLEDWQGSFGFVLRAMRLDLAQRQLDWFTRQELWQRADPWAQT